MKVYAVLEWFNYEDAGIVAAFFSKKEADDFADEGPWRRVYELIVGLESETTIASLRARLRRLENFILLLEEVETVADKLKGMPERMYRHIKYPVRCVPIPGRLKARKERCRELCGRIKEQIAVKTGERF